MKWRKRFDINEGLFYLGSTLLQKIEFEETFILLPKKWRVWIIFPYLRLQQKHASNHTGWIYPWKDLQLRFQERCRKYIAFSRLFCRPAFSRFTYNCKRKCAVRIMQKLCMQSLSVWISFKVSASSYNLKPDFYDDSALFHMRCSILEAWLPWVGYWEIIYTK